MTRERLRTVSPDCSIADESRLLTEESREGAAGRPEKSLAIITFICIKLSALKISAAGTKISAI